MRREGAVVDGLRRAFASGSVEPPAEMTCPSPPEIWDALHGELSPEGRRAVVKHLRACSHCAAEWRLAMEADAVSAPEREAPSVPPRWTARWWAIGVPLAAAAALVIGVGLLAILQQRGTTPPPSAFRTGETSEIRTLIPDGEALPRDRFLLRWAPVEEEARYTVSIHRRDLTSVAEARNLEEPEYLVPTEALASIPPGETLVWRVEAHLLEGSRVASTAFLVRVE